MKEFNIEKFKTDLISVRGDAPQLDYAKKFDVNRSTLSLLENGKQIPTINILNCLCNLTGNNVSDYFTEISRDSLVYLMGSLDSSDKERIEEMAERIRIKERYELLAERARNVNN